jgi:acetolactate decarboxylase
MKKIILLAMLAISSINYAKNIPDLYQVGTFASALNGAVNGDVNYQLLKKKGNFGLGTFNGITGEMVAYQGQFYQIGEKGITISVADETKTPYAQVIQFNPTIAFPLTNINNFKQLVGSLLPKFKNQNIAYAVHIHGQINYLKLRGRTPRKPGEPAPEEVPYEAINVQGDMVGFYFPEHLLSLTAPGLHLHFLSEDKQNSGHVMDVQFSSAKVELQPIANLKLHMPDTIEYQSPKVPVPTLDTYCRSQSGC